MAVGLGISFFGVIAACFALVSANCTENETLTNRLQSLRAEMKSLNVSAYLISHSDDHNSEYLVEADERLKFISGFSGSYGEALVTITSALLWTDSRYYIQAQQELPCGWNLLKLTDPDLTKWIEMNPEEAENVGFDPKKITFTKWEKIKRGLNATKFTALENNLVDEIWDSQPPYPDNHIYVHKLEFSGERYEHKIRALRKEMDKVKTDLFVVSQLDEIAWLLNLRGSDQIATPVFISYLLVGKNETLLFLRNTNVSIAVQKHLSQPGYKVEIQAYDDFWDELEARADISEKVYLTSTASYQIYTTVGSNKSHVHWSPILDMKAFKNPTEVQGSRNAHIRDAVALCKLINILEQEVPAGVYWDEKKIADELDRLKREQRHYKGISYEPIVAFGKNAALAHYRFSDETNTRVDTSKPLLMDVGAQYLDGTTDTTRTVHFGKPTAFQKKVYTSLLQGVADLGSTVFVEGARTDQLDIIVREPLLKLGLTYGHGSTHGTGIFLGVHESYNSTYYEGFIGSQEPGYYLENDFGMRLENLVVVVPAAVQQKEADAKKLLTFSPLTLVPYETSLIDFNLMDKSQIVWLNKYHELVRRQVGKEMIKQKLNDLYKWLIKKTEIIKI